MTKAEALELYDRAVLFGDGWEEAARAMAAALRPANKVAPKRKKNAQRGLPSVSGLSRKIPLFQKQNCGHTFNSAGCAICPKCERRPARFITESVPLYGAMARRERAAYV
jgi:hypothetical protein